MHLTVSFLQRLRAALRHDRVLVSAKALDEALDDLQWERADLLALLATLEAADFERTERSVSRPSDRIWVFCPECERGTLWIRLVERADFLVISFHLAGEP
jgi:hypothetical protein